MRPSPLENFPAPTTGTVWSSDNGYSYHGLKLEDGTWRAEWLEIKGDPQVKDLQKEAPKHAQHAQLAPKLQMYG